MSAIIDRLRSFSEAYPTDMFPELTAEERSALPRGIIDRISAAMGRHCAKIMDEAAESMNEWQDIETNPKDGEWFLGVSRCWDNGRQALCLRWSEGPHWSGFVDWDDDSYEDVTHWMPLPTPPTSPPA